MRSAFLAAPRSAVPHLTWPALLEPMDEQVFSLLYQLEQTQWWPPEVLLKRQFEQIQRLAEYARQYVPYYKSRLNAIARHAVLTPEIWREVPILSRSNLQGEAERLKSTALPKAHEPVKPVSTSGSTGKPITVLATRITSLYFRALNTRTHLWHLNDLRGNYCYIRSLGRVPGDGSRSGWSRYFPTGDSFGLDVFTPMAEQVDWLLDKAPRVLMTYPSNLELLLHEIRARGVAFPELEQVRTFGEALPDTLRQLCREVLGVELVDQYSSMELGMLAIQCPHDAGRYHIQSENVYLEVVNDDDEPCQPGEVGRMLATDLHNFAMPLLRYELGDLAEVGAPCSCGRGLPVINRILGRVREMLVMRDGSRRWPRGYYLLSDLEPLRQFQLVQKSLDSILFRMVTARPLTDSEEKDMRGRVRKAFGEHFNIRFEYCDHIDREASGKFKGFVCEVDYNAIGV